MHHRKVAERTAYYRQQASSCATAALTTAIAEVKQAYLDLEQGWLCLAPKVETNPNTVVDPKPGQDADLTPGRAIPETVSDMSRQDNKQVWPG